MSTASLKNTSHIAAFFDFDGIWYSTEQNWQVKDINIGSVGSSKTWQDVYLNWEKFNKQGKRLFDYYTPPHPRWRNIKLEDQNNITPPEALWEVAERHKMRNHDIYILSQVNSKELIEHTDIPSPYKSNIVRQNPFQEASLLHPQISLMKKKQNEIELVEKKLELILSLLRSTPMAKYKFCSQFQKEKRKIYDQIFLYYTQSEYDNIIKKTMATHREDFSAKRMAIISSYIVKVS